MSSSSRELLRWADDLVSLSFGYAQDASSVEPKCRKLDSLLKMMQSISWSVTRRRFEFILHHQVVAEKTLTSRISLWHKDHTFYAWSFSSFLDDKAPIDLCKCLGLSMSYARFATRKNAKDFCDQHVSRWIKKPVTSPLGLVPNTS